jgi:hypothetical protein
MEFMSLYTHGGIYLLPDNTQVRALLYNMEGLMLEWIFEDLGGVRKVGVLPNGQIIGYIVTGRDQFGMLYDTHPTDMTTDDLRPA